jgi:NAD(P)-dependent dehydrogenase (short-subunit alcohol dehydrogenase family)
MDGPFSPADRITGRVVLITGATDGIGRAMALQLGQMGARVLVHGRDPARGAEVVKQLEGLGARGAALVTGDFSSLAEVIRLAGAVTEATSRLDVLINNAGVYMNERRLTSDRHEMTFGVNHLAHAALTLWLLPLLTKSAPSRILIVSSAAHARAKLDFGNLQAEKSFDPYGAYALSKLANILFAAELAERIRGSGVTVNSLHPGVIQTKLLRAGFPDTRGRPTAEGAAVGVYLASTPDITMTTGAYFENRRPATPAPIARDRDARRHLWAATEALLRQAGAWRDAA